MNIFHALILGVIEGLSEFLPISSTFHLIVTSHLLALPSSDFVKMFEVVIQSGAIGALVLLYAKTLLKDRQLLFHIILSFLPTAVLGLALHKVIKNVFFETNWLMLAVFIGVGVLFIVVERILKRNHRDLTKVCTAVTPREAILIGFCQACSIIPGVSRAGAVILPMILLGYKRDEAAKYTFLLSLPTIFAASALDLYQGREILAGSANDWLLLAVGFVTALIIAYAVMRWFIRYLASHTLVIFGWYRLVLGGILLLLGY